MRGGTSGGRTVLTSSGREVIEHYDVRAKAVDVISRFGPRPAITVDGVIIKDRKILLIQRKNEPFKGSYALPGGFVDYKEPVEDAVVREVEEETGLQTKIKRMIGVYSAPDRDPRGHTISVVYEMAIKGGKVKAGSDAKSLKWFKLNELPKVAFDHKDIIYDSIKQKKK
ncbi:MAG: NUDIX hydrolase [Thermoplasmata archaeon]|nr:MAG: NUDIX hydrolase [Thermoplasmata archaeon]